MWELYDALIRGIPEGIPIRDFAVGRIWTIVRTEEGAGLSMTAGGASRPKEGDFSLTGATLNQMAGLVKSWNLPEASLGMAAINAYYNTSARMEALCCGKTPRGSSPQGLSLVGKKVALVGHLKLAQELLEEAKEVRILEREPQDGDYPDTACEYILPESDVVFVTGSAFANKTMPRLLALSQKAEIVMMGPTVPLAETLFDFGVSRLAGLVVTKPEEAWLHVTSGGFGPPHFAGERYYLDNTEKGTR